jgi:NAD(P)H-dependent FMN reductase
MKILAIIGSPRGKGNSYALTRKVEGKMKALGDVEFEYIFLRDFNLQPCRGCYLCLSMGEDKCPIKDDRPVLEKKMRDADGVVFVSPTYVLNVSGLMKNFMERFAYVSHRPRFFKRALAISTTGGVGQRITTFILAFTASMWGYSPTYRLGVIEPPLADEMLPPEVRERQRKKNDVMAEKAAIRFFRAIQSGMPAPGLLDVVLFEIQRAAFSRFKDGNVDREYWKSMGWFDGDCHYYYKARVGILKLSVATLAAKLFTRSLPKPLKDVRQMVI